MLFKLVCLLVSAVQFVVQGRSDKNGKKKTEAAAAALEERDKPYACDSEY